MGGRQRSSSRWASSTGPPPNARSLTNASAIRHHQVRAIFATFLGADAVPSPDVARFEQPLWAALHAVTLKAFRHGVTPLHAPCPEPKAAAVLALAWATADSTTVTISRDDLFVPHLEERTHGAV